MEEIEFHLPDGSSKVITGINPPLTLLIDSQGYTVKDTQTNIVAYFPLSSVSWVETDQSYRAQIPLVENS